MMDPIDFALDTRPTGQYRDNDSGLPINDPSGSWMESRLRDSQELASLLQSPRIAECLTRQLYRWPPPPTWSYTASRNRSSSVGSLRKTASASRSLWEFLVLSEGFRYAARPCFRRTASRVIMSRIIIPDGRFLKGMLHGAQVALALPLLESMTSACAEATAPRRCGLWFWGNGIRRAHWIPQTTGMDWMHPKSWLRFGERAPLRQRHHRPRDQDRDPSASLGMTGIPTGAKYHQVGTTCDTIVTTRAQKTVDRVAADHLGQGTLPILELPVAFAAPMDERPSSTCPINGPNNVNPSGVLAPALFNRLVSQIPEPAELSARGAALDRFVVRSVGCVDRSLRSIGAARAAHRKHPQHRASAGDDRPDKSGPSRPQRPS